MAFSMRKRKKKANEPGMWEEGSTIINDSKHEGGPQKKERRMGNEKNLKEIAEKNLNVVDESVL